jgi:hypothetical protein
MEINQSKLANDQSSATPSRGSISKLSSIVDPSLAS